MDGGVESNPGPTCTCPNRTLGTQGRHRKDCPRSQRGNTNTAENSPPQTPRSATEHVGAFDSSVDIPPLESLMSLHVPLLDRIPRGVAMVVSSLLAGVMQAAAQGSAAGWTKLLAFPKLVLGKCKRGGSKAVTATVKRRCLLWASGNFSQLTTEAHALAAGHAGSSTTSFPVNDEDDDQLGIGLSTDVEDSGQLDRRTVEKVIRLGKARCYQKAVNALSAAKVAPTTPETTAQMKEKHPSAAEPPLPLDVQTVEVPVFSEASVLKHLKSFKRGTAAGPSGLSAQHLTDLLGPASPLLGPLASLTNSIAKGSVPDGAREYVFGAKLVALVKKDGGLRPIACGEITRRLAAKSLGKLKEVRQLAKSLDAQVGVGVSSGADSMITCLRRVGATFLRAGDPRKGIIKIDLKNAFNLVDRAAILQAVKDLAPSLLPYALAAYARRSRLGFGDEVIWSECGVQQGDPLGPLLFCLVLHQVLQKVKSRLPQTPGSLGGDLDATAFYLDDGIVAGDWEKLAAWLATFQSEGEKCGMYLNRAKSEAVSHPDAPAPAYVQDMKQVKLDNWEVLGAPCGTPHHVREAVSALLLKAERRAKAIASLPDPHVALALIRMSAGFSTVVHLMRSTGSIGDFAFVDSFTRRALATITGATISKDREWTQASLPLRMGGLGLHSCSNVAALAGIAAAGDGARGMIRLASPSMLETLTPCIDPVCVESLKCSRLAHFPEVQTAVRDSLQANTYQHHRQKTWSKQISEARHKAFLSKLSTKERARISSCSAKHASIWLYGCPDSPPDLWLAGPEFIALIRIRLGLPVSTAPCLCTLCGKVQADIWGDHSLSCMAAGARTRLHNELRNSFAALARLAFLAPILEPQPFSTTTHKGKRVDVAYIMNDSIHLVDVAVTHSVQQNAINAASASPGGAATSYQKVKEDKYLPAIAAEPAFVSSRMVLIPVVFDTFGAAGEKGAAELDLVISTLQRRRLDMPATTVSQVAFHKLLFGVMRGVARILLANSTWEIGEDDMDTHLLGPLEGDRSASADSFECQMLPTTDPAPAPETPTPPTPPEASTSNNLTQPNPQMDMEAPAPSREGQPNQTKRMRLEAPPSVPPNELGFPSPLAPQLFSVMENSPNDSKAAEHPAGRVGAETGDQTLDSCKANRPGIQDATSPGVALLLGEGEGGTDVLRGNGHRRAGGIQDSRVLLEEQDQGEEASGCEARPVSASGEPSPDIVSAPTLEPNSLYRSREQGLAQLRAPEGAKRRRSQDQEEESIKATKVKRKAHSCPPLPQHSNSRQGRPAGSCGGYPTLPHVALPKFSPTPTPGVAQRRVHSQPPPKQETTAAKNVIVLDDGSFLYWPGGGAPSPEQIKDLLFYDAPTASPKPEASSVNNVAPSPSPSPSPSHSSLSLSASPPPQRA